MDSEYGDIITTTSSPQPVQFRITSLIRPLYLDWERSEPLVFCYRAAGNITVSIRTVTEDERSFDYETNLDVHDDAYCVAETAVTPPSDVYSMFTDLAHGRLPLGSTSIGFPNLLMTLPNAPDDLHLNHLPAPLTEFAKELYDILLDLSQRTVDALRWRIGVSGPHAPIKGYATFAWSLDGETWHWQCNDPQARYETIPMHGAASDAISDIQQIVVAGKTEPLGHTLWREAWEQKRENPRSALVIGLAAAEVGVKESMATLVPEAQRPSWFAHDRQAPPLIRLVADEIPKLPVKLTIGGMTVAPPDNVQAALRDGVMHRNRTVHRGAQPPTPIELEMILLAVRDLLWMLDFYCGAEWALENLQAETCQALGVPPHFGLRGTRGE